MAEKNWTPEQKQAIENRTGTLLVSAAAGSGKTAVLVERVVSMLLDETHPVDADRLLVVTFSKAAAQEMRQRIEARLARAQAEDPQNRHIRRQRFLMERAHISTIHAFCLDLISQHPEELDLPSDISLADESRLALLRQEAAAQSIEAFYAADSSGAFSALVELLSGGRDDRRVEETIFQLYGFLRSHPFYDDWLAEKKEMYQPGCPVAQTVWGKTILAYGKDAVSYCLQLNQEITERMRGILPMEQAYGGPLEEDRRSLSQLLEELESGDWDSCCHMLQNFSFPRLGSLRGFSDEGRKAFVQAGRDRVKKIIKALAQRQFCATSEEFQEDLADLRPKVSMLFSLTQDFDRRFSQCKREQKLLDFSDLEHFSLQLLLEKTDHGYEPTALARQLSQEFEEVLVDEYQDTNGVQDMLFQSISRQGKNLFMVGDVKQSIYRFRQAMPELFLQKMDTYAPLAKGQSPAKIVLGKNFRSRSEVTGFVNFVFRQLMSRQMGEMDYSDEEELVAAAPYPPEEKAPQLHLIDTSGSDQPAAQQEAEYVAGQIVQLVSGGAQVWENGAARPVGFGDICVLLRSPKDKSQVYRDAFLRVGIHSWADSKNGFLQSKEIRTVVALLQVLDNPYRDIPLLTVLLSDLFGFSVEQIARIRLADRRGPFYSALLQKAGEEENIAAFLRQLDDLRRFAAGFPVPDLLTELYARTNYPAIVRAYPMGEAREANLHLLISYAAQFQKNGGRGLYAFVRFLDRLSEQKVEMESGMTANGGDAVHIMSIHRSKGLEFPYVFLCDTAKAFNRQDQRQRIAMHPQMGFACVRRDAALLKEFTTVPLEALRLENERSSMSEELRILYVALTRAKEKLMITMAGDPEKMLQKAAAAFDGPIQPFAVRSADSIGTWLLMCALRHPDGQTLREKAQLPLRWRADAQSPLQIVLAGAQAPAGAGEALPDGSRRLAEPDPATLETLRENAAWRYPHEQATRIPQKLGVSAVAKRETASRYAFTKTPRFLTGETLSGAQRGDALHRFMQYADYARCAADPQEELERLTRMEFLTPAQAQVIPLQRVARFFSSPLYRRIASSGRIERELRFLWEIDGRQMGFADAGEEKITVQGVADCVFWEDGQLVIVDYKTDVVASPEALAEKYQEQLRLYRLILQQSLQTPVKECILYSFHLGQQVLLTF